MKKTVSLALASVVMLTSLAACGGNNANTEETATNKPSTNDAATNKPENGGTEEAAKITGDVVFLTNRTDMIDKQYVDYEKRFEEKYPGVDLKFEAITDYDKTLKIRIASGDFPDVVFTPTIPNAELPNYFAPLDDIAFSGDIHFKDLKAQEGKMYGISSGGSTVGIVYNKKAFEKAGITALPKTYDEFLAASQKLKDAGIVPLASNFKDKWPLDVWVYDMPTLLAGASDHQNKRAESDTPYTMDNAYGKSWSIIREMHTKGFLEADVNSTNWEQSKKDVASGKFGMYLLGNWVINQVIENGAPAEDVGFFPFPVDNSGEAKAPLNPDFFYAVNKNGNVEAGKAFVQWMIEESGYDDFAGFIPTLKDKESKLPQLSEFNTFSPKFFEPAAPIDAATEIQNKAQLDQAAVVQEFVLSKDPQKVLDKVNTAWAKAKKDLGL
ncbi:ABC-type glycerol-3-phosphate transport system substrate-binding protein [Paenibacillus endophyticus]|uniref:ABC-type glycerol-3-phosphate transport system substrate-binding protein n=1 Tax=Paenibacillus endophyticus TaxID=1294268 RepID=A0A7W5G948_9BACL|nr:extracellular solute-binding protein [Paenibacillus endophyticus]MBB3150968.1 ABC-type glycerol-3-phosphate transport system substrate-binding protein [Paenibacillus endophyticus]